MKIKAYRLQGNTWLLVDPVGDEGQATVTAKDERGIKAQLADVAVITYGWHRPEIVLMSGNPPLNAVSNARRVRVLKAERLVPEYLIGQIVDVVGGRGDDVFVKDPKFPRLDVPILLKKGEYEVANAARNAKFKVGDRVGIRNYNGTTWYAKIASIKNPSEYRVDGIGKSSGLHMDVDEVEIKYVLKKNADGDWVYTPVNSVANSARSCNAVVQKALNSWVPVRGFGGYQWKETPAERRIKSELRAAGAKKADYLPWNHGTAKTGNYDTLSWHVVAHEDNVEKVAAKMRQLGMIDVSKPKWDAYDDFYVVGYTKIGPMPENSVARNATGMTEIEPSEKIKIKSIASGMPCSFMDGGDSLSGVIKHSKRPFLYIDFDVSKSEIGGKPYYEWYVHAWNRTRKWERNGGQYKIEDAVSAAAQAMRGAKQMIEKWAGGVPLNSDTSVLRETAVNEKFKVGDRVGIRNYNGTTWYAKIVSIKSPSEYRVDGIGKSSGLHMDVDEVEIKYVLKKDADGDLVYTPVNSVSNGVGVFDGAYLIERTSRDGKFNVYLVNPPNKKPLAEFATREEADRFVADREKKQSSGIRTTNSIVAKAWNACAARNGYVVLRTASGGTGRVYEGEEVEFDGKTYTAKALGSPNLDKATLVDGTGNKIVVQLRDTRLTAKNACRVARNGVFLPGQKVELVRDISPTPMFGKAAPKGRKRGEAGTVVGSITRMAASDGTYPVQVAFADGSRHMVRSDSLRYVG